MPFSTQSYNWAVSNYTIRFATQHMWPPSFVSFFTIGDNHIDSCASPSPDTFCNILLHSKLSLDVDIGSCCVFFWVQCFFLLPPAHPTAFVPGFIEFFTEGSLCLHWMSSWTVVMWRWSNSMHVDFWFVLLHCISTSYAGVSSLHFKCTKFWEVFIHDKWMMKKYTSNNNVTSFFGWQQITKYNIIHAM